MIMNRSSSSHVHWTHLSPPPFDHEKNLIPKNTGGHVILKSKQHKPLPLHSAGSYHPQAIWSLILPTQSFPQQSSHNHKGMSGNNDRPKQESFCLTFQVKTNIQITNLTWIAFAMIFDEAEGNLIYRERNHQEINKTPRNLQEIFVPPPCICRALSRLSPRFHRGLWGDSTMEAPNFSRIGRPKKMLKLALKRSKSDYFGGGNVLQCKNSKF